MLFNSIDFAVFLPVVFLVYWFLASSKLPIQNSLLLIASYVFYGWWDWRFLILIAFSSLVDYLVGIGLAGATRQRNRKLLLALSICVNLGALGLFKYYNFFLDNFSDAFSILGHSFGARGLDIVLPVGISFYTFQTLSYSIDVYRRRLEPTRDLVAFFAFVSFFPQLVAGPIERSSNLLTQFFGVRRFRKEPAVDGMRQILWGLFKKIVVADNCAVLADSIFDQGAEQPGSALLLGAFFFAFQIYGDFSGYSDIAIGTSRLFGFNLRRNFAFPYFSRDIAEFWRRWHISLSTWFRDYVYIPFGGSRGGNLMIIRNTFLIFLLSGFWHGANWTFVAWGALNALYFLPLILLQKNRMNVDTVAEGRSLPSFRETLAILTTFFLTLIGWVFFRSASIDQAFLYLAGIFSVSLFERPEYLPDTFLTVTMIILLVLVEWVQRTKQHGLQISGLAYPKAVRWGMYYCLVTLIAMFGGEKQQFIYFQF